MQPKFVSSTIRIKPKAAQSPSFNKTGSGFWDELSRRVKKAATVDPAQQCILALHFQRCTLVSVEEIEAHMGCTLCQLEIIPEVY